MANLYEIDTKLVNAIECGCDVETGEFIDEKGIEDLYMELNRRKKHDWDILFPI